MTESVSLSEEFKASAKSYIINDDIVTLPMLLTKYSVLQRYKVTDGAERDAIASSLFNCGMTSLDALVSAQPGKTYIPDEMPAKVNQIFAKLLEPESANHIPARAPARLADVALELLRKAEAAQDSEFLDHEKRPDYKSYREYKAKIPAIAALALKLADAFDDALSKSNANVTTAGPVTPSKVLQLKPAVQAS